MSVLADRRLRELLHLLAYLRKHPGAHLRDLAAALGMTPKAARGLIEQATMCGVAPFDPSDLIEIVIDDRDRVHLELDQRLGEPVQLSRPEALSLVVALRALGSEGDLGPAAGRVLAKLRAALSAPVADQVADMESRLAFEGDDAGVAGRLATLRRGLEERHAVDIVYYTASRDELTSRRLRPYALLQHLGHWYAVGRDSLRKEIRIFRLERIKEATLTDEAYDIPASFKPERYRKKGKLLVGRSYREARVLFRDPVARVVREEWPAELIELRDDGSVVGTLHYVALEGIANWLLAHGAAAEVIDPPELRDAVRDRARCALERYRTG